MVYFQLSVLSIILIVLVVSYFDGVSHVFGPFIPSFLVSVIGNLVLGNLVFPQIGFQCPIMCPSYGIGIS